MSESCTDKWSSWIEQIAKIVIDEIVYNEQVFSHYKQIVESNPRIDREGYNFHRWVYENYSSRLLLALRKQSEIRKDTISLARLLDELNRKPEYINFQFYSRMYGDDQLSQGIAGIEFAKFTKDGNKLDSNIPMNDLKSLRVATEDLARYVSSHIAHKTVKNDSIKSVQRGQVDEAIVVIKNLVKKYYLLLRAVGYELDEVVDIPWERIFTQKWVQSSD